MEQEIQDHVDQVTARRPLLLLIKTTILTDHNKYRSPPLRVPAEEGDEDGGQDKKAGTEMGTRGGNGVIRKARRKLVAHITAAGKRSK